ncbi:MAG: hypothetical protein AAFQ07_05685, partial [Chloroflexota bacterium]
VVILGFDRIPRDNIYLAVMFVFIFTWCCQWIYFRALVGQSTFLSDNISIFVGVGSLVLGFLLFLYGTMYGRSFPSNELWWIVYTASLFFVAGGGIAFIFMFSAASYFDTRVA